MANMLLPLEERNLTPDQVESLDKRRRRGHLFLVLCFQTGIIATLLTVWAGQDLTYSPGWIHPMAYYCAALYALCAFFAISGLRLRRGHPEFN
ncbi:MAG TPA: hypothetical protein VGB94_09560 [Acidobacteriaceae bacterium]